MQPEPAGASPAELADSIGLRRQVGQLLARYHYRGFTGPVGENIQYLARDGQGRQLAVRVFGASAWKVAVRDQFIGWSVPQRQQHLSRIANQQRFLILPWVRVPHLASHLLVAKYSWLLLAGHQCYGPTRTDIYEPLPTWRRGAERPSCLDLIILLRKQLAQKPLK